MCLAKQTLKWPSYGTVGLVPVLVSPGTRYGFFLKRIFGLVFIRFVVVQLWLYMLIFCDCKKIELMWICYLLFRFDLYFRKNPFGGEYTVFSGLEECIRFIANFKLTEDEIDFVRQSLSPSCEVNYIVFLVALAITSLFSYGQGHADWNLGKDWSFLVLWIQL